MYLMVKSWSMREHDGRCGKSGRESEKDVVSSAGAQECPQGDGKVIDGVYSSLVETLHVVSHPGDQVDCRTKQAGLLIGQQCPGPIGHLAVTPVHA